MAGCVPASGALAAAAFGQRTVSDSLSPVVGALGSVLWVGRGRMRVTRVLPPGTVLGGAGRLHRVLTQPLSSRLSTLSWKFEVPHGHVLATTWSIVVMFKVCFSNSLSSVV